ncbi:uncharacterized protein [Drosophila takahashii]|uniref:uncharacterized protein isoform X2 n=1 Tax=Drosophila takahashii TaxID=29030 RepID=UPI0038996A82
MVIASAYMAHDEPAPPEPVIKLLQWAEDTKTTLVLGCDANARHTLWGSSETNERDDFDDSGSNYSDNKSKSGSDDEFLQSFKNNEKKRSSFEKIQRKRWTAEEINALTIEFGEPAQISKLPSLKKCIEVINRNPHLKDRTPQQVKSWIDNQRKAEGRKTGSSLNKKKY